MGTVRLALCLLVAAGLWGCAGTAKPQPNGLSLLPTSDAKHLSANFTPRVQGITSLIDLAPAVEKSLAAVSRNPADRSAGSRLDPDLTYGQLRQTLERLLTILPGLDADPGLLARRFNWVELNPKSLMTGYYEPQLEASLTPDPNFPAALYGVPPDLKSLDLGAFHPRWEGQKLQYRVDDGEARPYHDRRAIDINGTLRDQGLEIAWVKDPVDVYFLQVQGSGRLEFSNGTSQHVLYSGKNGLPYISLGKILVDRGLLPADQVNMFSIRQVLADLGPIRLEIMADNPSYVFFRLAEDGPYGAMKAVLTPFVSVASDPKLIPLGSVLVVEVDLPSQEGVEPEVLRGIVLPQDVGGAITNLRLDLFCGTGQRAEFVAGKLASRARVFLLTIKENENAP